MFIRPLRRLRGRLFRPLEAKLVALQAGQRSLQDEVRFLREDAREARFAIASIQAVRARDAASMDEAAFRAYSQFGEDGVIQWLIARIPIASRNFVEFGVEDYRESNTRFLLEHDGWSGLILDAGTAHIRFVRSTDLAWRAVVDARSTFVTAENINELAVRPAGRHGPAVDRHRRHGLLGALGDLGDPAADRRL